MPNNQKIKVRRYTDTPDHCSIFYSLLPDEDLAVKKALEKSPFQKYIFGIIHFLLKKEGLKTIDYYNVSYKSIDLSRITNLKEFTFEKRKCGK